MIDKIKKINFIELFILIMPFIDMLNTITGLSVSLYARGVFLAGLLFYFVFFNKSKIKKISYYLLVILATFSVIYIYHYFTLNNTYNIFEEITTLIKFLYLPITTIVLLNYYDNKKLDINKIIIRLTIIYCLCIIIPTIFNFSDKSYAFGKKGYVGLFYAPNEISSILALISPFVILNTFKEKYKLLNVLLSILFIITCFILGTKTPVIGLVITLLASLFITIYNALKNHQKIKEILIILLLIFFTIFIYKDSYLHYNLSYQENQYNIQNQIPQPPNSSNANISEYEKFLAEINKNNLYINFPTQIYKAHYSDNKILNLIFSNRNNYVNENFNKYKNTTLSKKLFGLSLGNKPLDNSNSNMSEIDIIDIFIYYGILGLLIIFGYLLLTAIMVIIKFFKKFNYNMQNYSLCAACISFAIILLMSMTAGHTLSAPTVTTFASFIITYLIKELKLNLNKIVINVKIFVLIVIIFSMLSIGVILYFNNQTFTVNITLGDNISFDKEVILVEQTNTNYSGITDKLTYYVPSEYKNIQIIHVERELLANNKIDFFTIVNSEDVNIVVNINLAEEIEKSEINKNSVFVKSTKNLLISNSYYYKVNSEITNSFNKNSVKNLINENTDIIESSTIKNIHLKPNTYVDTYIITSENKLITKDETIPWIAFNGFYNQINNNVYIRDLGIFDYNYKSDVIQDMLKNSFLINLYNYSNNFNSLWYNDYYYKNQNNYSGYFLDPTLNYNIASILNKYDINDTNNIYSNFANLIKTEYNNGNYLQFGNGIIFNKIYEPTFNNQISTINLLIKYYKNNYDYQVKKIISLLINQLSNQNWLLDSKDNIHAYINSNNEYVGTIFENILPNLSELKTNLKAININTDFVDRYIEIFKTSIEKNVETN